MLKKISTLALAGLLALPVAASAGSNSELAAKIDQLSRELAQLKAQMETMKEDQEDFADEIDEKSEAWDLASRFKFYGDFRARMDYYDADLVSNPVNMNNWQKQVMYDAVNTPAWSNLLSPNTTTSRQTKFQHLYNYMQTSSDAYHDDDMTNDTVLTNRFRLNMRVKATENVEFKGRLAMYKTWGTNTLPPQLTQFGYPSFDGTSSREPADSTLRVDRAFVNWNNIGGQPMWFSIGRRPTTDGPAAQVRMGTDERMATPVAYMDWPFDGISLGYAYANLFGMEDWPGRVRICYGRGFEDGLQYEDGESRLNDTDFAGLSWDIYKKGDRFAYIQSFMVFNAFSYPEFDDDNTNDFYAFFLGPRENVGDVLHTSAVYQDKWENLTYFIAGGWSRTMPDDDNGMFNDMVGQMKDMMFMTSNYSVNDDDEDGYNIWLGVRYDLDEQGLKFGLEYNHGSRYWIGMTPGHDDMYSAKLGTRGDVYEAYMIWDLPTGEAISKYAKTFMRLGYQHYEFDYTGGTDWNIKPYDVDDADGEMWGALMPTLDKADQVYLTFEAYF